MSDLSYSDKQQAVAAAIRAKYGGELYVVELYDDHAIYEEYAAVGGEAGTWQVAYSIDGNGAVTLSGDRVKVVRKTTYMAVKRVAPDVVEGLAIPYGVDVDGEQFTPETDLCLDWFGKSGRPLIYDHGFDALGPSVIGRQVEYEEREDGRWAQAQLNRSHKYRKAVDRLVEEGALGFSSGAMPHLVTMSKSTGRITRWPWVELSLTPVPAHPGAMVHYAKSAELFRHLEESEADMTTFLKAALGAVLEEDRDAAPGTASLDDRAGRVSAAIDEFRDHARAAAAMRTKAGRVLSAANRDRIAKALASREAVMAAYGDLEALLAETDPESAAKSTRSVSDELALEAIAARWLVGVEVQTI